MVVTGDWWLVVAGGGVDSISTTNIGDDNVNIIGGKASHIIKTQCDCIPSQYTKLRSISASKSDFSKPRLCCCIFTGTLYYI